MEPPWLDVQILRMLGPLQARPALVDAVDVLSHNALWNGFVFVVPLFLFWHFSAGGRRWLAQRLLLTIVLGAVIGLLVSVSLQQLIHWPPPPAHPALQDVFALRFRENPNPTSFPSDSAIQYSIVAFGTAAWSRKLSLALLAWLILFVAPAKIFVGGHYLSDVLAGVVLGFGSLRLSAYVMGKFPRLERLASNSSVFLRLTLFLWLFETGNGFRDLTDLWRGLRHIRLHLG